MANYESYYFLYAIVCIALGVIYVRAKSLEELIVTSKEFKAFQSSFVFGNGVMALGELLAIASFYPTFTVLGCDIGETTNLYLITVVSTTVCGVGLEVADFGTRKVKCTLSAVLYFVALFSLCCDDHYDMLMMGRVIYGAGCALHHGLDQSSFENYAIYQHTTQGFPDDWLSNTFATMAHSIALVAAVSGMVGQTAASSGTLGVVGLCCVVFAFATAYIAVLWPKDVSSSRFMLSGFMSNLKQTLETAKTNTTMQYILMISAFYESTVIIFTFYWAPWLAGMVPTGDDGVGQLPYEIIYSAFVVCTMIGNYLFTLYAGDIGAEQVFRMCLLGTAVLFSFGSVVFSPALAFWVSVGIQVCGGVYWPSIGTLKGKYIAPEFRSAATSVSRIVTVAIAYIVLHMSHDSPFLIMLACGGLAGGAGYCNMMLVNRNVDDEGDELMGFEKDED